MSGELKLAIEQLRQLGRFGGGRLEVNVFDSEQQYLNALEKVVGHFLATSDELREAVIRYNQFRDWASNHYEPADGDPYKDSEDSFSEDVELLAEAFATEHDENKKGGVA